jgi:hypothetical protein
MTKRPTVGHSSFVFAGVRPAQARAVELTRKSAQYGVLEITFLIKETNNKRTTGMTKRPTARRLFLFCGIPQELFRKD